MTSRPLFAGFQAPAGTPSERNGALVRRSTEEDGHNDRRGKDMKGTIRATCVAAVAALALFVGVSTASAGVVRMTTCINGGGSAMTTSGPLQLSLAWGTRSTGMLDYFMKYQSVVYSVNGVSTTTTEGSFTGWGPVTPGVDQDGKSLYARRYTSPVIANLAPGDSVNVTFVFQASKKVQDDNKPPGSFQGPGLLFPTISCTITAT